MSRYHGILLNVLPQAREWRVELSRGQLYIQYDTATGERHSSDLMGDGMASLFRIALAIFDSCPGDCLLVDEPELSLHPQAQKRLASYLSRCASERQILVATHSPYFVSWSDLTNGAHIYRLAMTSIGATAKNLSQPALTTIQGLFTDWQKPNLLDAVAKEIFFADEVVFFEGQEDVGLLRKFAIEHNREPLEVFGYGVGGSGNIKHFLKMAEELGIRACAIYDGDKTAEKAEAEQLFPVSLIELLPTADIRDKHAKDASGRDAVEIKKEGLFDRNGVIKPAYKQYLLDLMDRVTAHFNGPQ